MEDLWHKKEEFKSPDSLTEKRGELKTRKEVNANHRLQNLWDAWSEGNKSVPVFWQQDIII